MKSHPRFDPTLIRTVADRDWHMPRARCSGNETDCCGVHKWLAQMRAQSGVGAGGGVCITPRRRRWLRLQRVNPKASPQQPLQSYHPTVVSLFKQEEEPLFRKPQAQPPVSSLSKQKDLGREMYERSVDLAQARKAQEQRDQETARLALATHQERDTRALPRPPTSNWKPAPQVTKQMKSVWKQIRDDHTRSDTDRKKASYELAKLEEQESGKRAGVG